MHTLQEIQAQPDIWRTIIPALEASHLPKLAADRTLVFSGCGSAYYLGLTCAAFIRQRAKALPASEIIFFPEHHISPDTTLLVASRSGKSSETLEAMRMFHGHVIGVTPSEDSQFSALCDHCVTLPPISEQSVVQTASITSMSIAMLAILAGGAEPFKALPQHAERLLTQYEPMIERLAGGSWERVFFLGMGPFYGVANEAMLKMKEAALVDCDAFHTLEFRHGPSALVDQKTLIVGLLGPQTARHESRLLAEMHQNGATVISFSENPQTLPDSIQQINLQAGLGPMAQAILYQPLLQLLAIYRAQLRGINPDHPRNLTPFVHIDEDLT